MKNKISIWLKIIIAVLFLINIFSRDTSGKENKKVKTTSGWTQIPKIMSEISLPKFPDRNFNILKFGAVSDGKSLNTDAINNAINECSESGGGTVVIPKGEFLTGAIHLKSNVNLHISEGAILKFSTNPKDFLPAVLVGWEGSICMNYSPLIYAYGQKNIAVSGKGIIDGQASNESWWKWKTLSGDKESRPRLLKLNDEKVPFEKRIFGDGYYLRPTMIEFFKCKNILIEGVTLKDSPFWFLHPILSSNITIDGVKTNSIGPNTDGCDPEFCSDVIIKNCVFSDGDDCIAIKSGRNNDGRKINIPSKNIIIKDCTMKDGHGGVSIGSEVSGGCNNVYVENCQMNSPALDRMLRIKSNAKRGGVVEDIYVRNIKIGQVKGAIVELNMNYDPKEAKGFSFYPIIKNIYIENVTSQKSQNAFYFEGLPNSNIKNVIIRNCKFDGVKADFKISNTKNLELKNVYINGKIINNQYSKSK